VHTKQDATVAYSVVVPVYNSTESLVELHRRLVQTFETTIQASFEILFVDDASPNPATWPTIESIKKEDPRVRAFQLMRNSGQHNATMCGLRHTRGSYVVMMDDDLQHPPEEVPKLIEALRQHPRWDAVLGVPEHRAHASYRNVASILVNRFIGWSIRKPPHVTLASFRLITRELCDALVEYKGHIITIGSLICMCTQGVGNAEVAHASRAHGKSGYSYRKLIGLAVSNVFNFSDLPLKIISWLGFLSAVLAVAMSIYILYLKLTGGITQAGFATIVLLVSFYSGALLFAVGILGQYIMRIMRAATAQQQFTVRHARSQDEDLG